MDLPPELLFKIFEFLPSTALASIAPTCRQWRAVATTFLYTNIEHPAWKPKRVSLCLNALAHNFDGNLSALVRHLDLRLWSIDPEFSHLLVDALMQTNCVVRLKLSMSEAFSNNFESNLLQRGIIATSSVGEGNPQLWIRQFLPNLEELELSHGHRPFQLAAGRPVRCISSPTHLDYKALEHLIPFFQRSLGPLQTIHFNLTGRDTTVASMTLGMVAQKLPCLTHVFFNFFVSKRAHRPKYTPDLLEELSSLSSLHSAELLLSRHARSHDPYLYSHFAAVHTLKATAPPLTHVVLDTIRWRYRAPPPEGTDGFYGWSPIPCDIRTHAWWLGQYGSAYSAHLAMMALWKDYEWRIPLPHEIGRSISPNDSMSINESEI